MGVVIRIFTYLGDDEETPIVRFYGVEKAFYKAFKGDINIIKEKYITEYEGIFSQNVTQADILSISGKVINEFEIAEKNCLK